MKLTPERVLRLLENFGKTVCLLPLDSNSSRILSILTQFAFYFTVTNMLSLIFCILVSAHLESSKYILVTKLLGLSMLYLEVLSNTIIWRVKKSAFQNLLQEVHNYFQCAEIKKQKVINEYIDRYKYFYTFQIVLSIFIFVIRIIIAPSLQPDKLPYNVWFPFPVKPFTFDFFFIFFLQTINAIQCSSQIIFPLIVAIIFLHISMKLEILTQDIQKVRSSDQLITCIQRHQDCIKTVYNINYIFGVIMVKTYFLMGLAVIFASIPLIHDLNFFTMLRACFTIMDCLLCAYIYNGAADDLYRMSQSVAVTLCGLEWNDELFKMRRSLLIMICRAQKPLVISPLDGLMPALTRKVYTSFLFYIISYIMTLRAIVSSH